MPGLWLSSSCRRRPKFIQFPPFPTATVPPDPPPPTAHHRHFDGRVGRSERGAPGGFLWVRCSLDRWPIIRVSKARGHQTLQGMSIYLWGPFLPGRYRPSGWQSNIGIGRAFPPPSITPSRLIPSACRLCHRGLFLRRRRRTTTQVETSHCGVRDVLWRRLPLVRDMTIAGCGGKRRLLV